MSEADSPWARLACRIVRVAMARKECTYSSLVQFLASDGVEDTERSLVLRINRGSLRLSSWLHILTLMSATVPELWRSSLPARADWPGAARDVVLVELKEGGVTELSALTEQLARLGTTITEEALESHIMTGTISLALFLQLLFIVRSHSLERYVDFSDILKTADKAMA
ncbi:hypothetical protein AWB74_08515 [Caballeronia arvi]|uniref:DUF6471 domain-containing protein n=1 Tax=Caballeronia arvi TaxID=1777135 RepID=A0A158L4Q8_9BURK|nr:DUF6471 domain-containing protein [Caballeronia arvi]SAL88338.1 hypothetical protein AWB74_08515 [Caballeronia arvi]